MEPAKGLGRAVDTSTSDDSAESLVFPGTKTTIRRATVGLFEVPLP